MSLTLSNVSRWLKGGKRQNPKASNGFAPGSSLESSDILKPTFGRNAGTAYSSEKVRRKRHNRENRKIDRDYDVVVVPPDGVCFSGSESDDSDYSVGWLEPHGPGFESDDGEDNSFAVLVRCYGQREQDAKENLNKKAHDAIMTRLPGNVPAESKKYMEQFLSSLRTV